MNFLVKNKRIVNFLFPITLSLDIIIGFLINKISSDSFNILNTHNIIIFVIFIVLVFAYIICEIIIHNGTSPVRKSRLQRAFQESGGYETIVNEMKSCIENHDYKSIKELTKVVKIIEK